MTKTKLYQALPLLLLGILVAYITYLTPMQSDDFSYHTMGVNLQDHIDHYNSWSGRFLADYISPLILLTPYKIVQSIIITIAAIGMIFVISILPSRIFSQPYSIHSFIVLFLIYWLSNPTLGQTIFWVVGAANYLFTNFIIVLYLWCFIEYIKSHYSTSIYIFLLVLSALVGFTSENTTWIVLLFSLTSTIYLMTKKQDKKIILSFILVTISFYFMIFSPGNMNRANSDAFVDFYTISFLERVLNFIIYRAPTALVRMLPIILPMLILFWIAKKNQLSQKSSFIFYTLCFISLLSLGSMVMSPTLTYRSLSGPILFLLLACSLLLTHIYHQTSLKLKQYFYALCSIMILMFIVSYTMISYSYQHLYAQDKIISHMIQEAQLSQPDELTLPEYHYIPSLRARDSHDQYTNAHAMAIYHRVNKIQLHPMTFDYSAITGQWLPIHNDYILKRINLSPYGLMGLQGSNIILETWQSMNQQRNLVLEITTTDQKVQTMTVPLHTMNIDGHHIIGFVTKARESTITSIRYTILFDNQQPVIFHTIYQHPISK